MCWFDAGGPAGGEVAPASPARQRRMHHNATRVFRQNRLVAAEL